jgi:hypothetical protein
MKVSATILFLMALMVLPAISIADTIFLKNGRRIEANECWEEDNLVVCKQYGATIGYRKNDISIYQATGEKPSQQVRIDESVITGQYQLGITDKVQSMWSYDGDASIDPDLATAKISFTIVQNGDVQDIDFIELSKDPYLNIAAFSAIMKSLPFPSFPPEMTVMNLKLLLVFTFEGVQ